MSVSAYEVARHFDHRCEQVTEAMGWYEQLRQSILSHIEAVSQQAEAARLELARAYLPQLSADALQRAERLSGYRGFSRRDPLQALAREAGMLQRTVARIRADVSYQRREFLVGAAGEHTLEREEAVQMLSPWEEECARYERLEDFVELVAIGYDTPQFTELWLTKRYWRHWASGDRICGALGLDDFGDDVLPAWNKLLAERTRWRAEVARIDRKIDAVHALAQQHDGSVARMPQLPGLFLEQAQAAMAEFLEHADLALLAQWVDDDQVPDRALTMGLRKAAGLEAKLGYLRELETEAVKTILTDLGARLGKYQHKLRKFARKGGRLVIGADVTSDQKFDLKYEKFRRRHRRLEMLVQRLAVYDSYHRFDLCNEPDLWWYEFTRSRPSRLTPRLRAWYDQRPELRPRHDRSQDQARTTAALADATAAQAAADDLGYLS